MTHLFGSSRNVVKERYALLTPAGFVAVPLPGWTDAACVVLISPAMGARFSQMLITLSKTGRGSGDTGETELVAYVLDGSCRLSVSGDKQQLVSGSYAFIPPEKNFDFSNADENTRLLIFQKKYEPLPKTPKPEFLVDQADDHPGLPFLGDPDARLQTLLPDTPSFDMAVNIFTYQPGATLPMVETHVMEHGLLMLAGQGIYRLDSDWHPVQAGDVIWMAPYCPQWFVAMGKAPASYIYYKDVNRAPMG
jgi:(S)-ureidoglycine aminohydrolase